MPTLRAYRSRPALRPDWESRFVAWLEEAHDQTHAYGRSDCILQCAGAVRAQTGRDFAAGHRGKYRSARGALRYLKALGFDTPAELIDAVLDRVPPAFAQRGDLVLVKVPRGSPWRRVPGVCVGGDALISVDGSGPVRVPRSAWVAAWSVGRRLVGAGE